MKASNPFKETIKAYLEKRASEDELFAVTYKKENKNIEECYNYVMQRAKSGGFNAYTDEEVFGWAVHYYDEDDIKNVKPIKGTATVAKQPKKSVKEKPLVQQVKDSKKATKKKEESLTQISMFDGL